MKNRPLITCREFLDFIAAYLEDGLTESERLDFEAHLGVCPDCESYLEGYRESIRLGRAALLDDDEALEAAPDQLVRAILAARRS